MNRFIKYPIDKTSVIKYPNFNNSYINNSYINNSYINKISPITINKPKFCYRCYSTIEPKDYNCACSNNLTHKFISCNIL